MVVLTDYNNKFYRIDDVDFSTSPESTFKTKSGNESFIDYYKRVSLKKYFYIIYFSNLVFKINICFILLNI